MKYDGGSLTERPLKGRPMMMRRARILALLSCALVVPGFGVLAQAQQGPAVYRIDLIPPPHPEFHERMGGWPTQISKRTFHAAVGTLTIYAHEGGRTILIFDMEGLLPYGVYTFWDVTNPDFEKFADRPLANVPSGADPKAHWWNDVQFDKDGGPGGFGLFGFMADRRGTAHVVVELDHRPGKEFLLDYHADGHVRGGVKGRDVFPGVLWARFPAWDSR